MIYPLSQHVDSDTGIDWCWSVGFSCFIHQ